MSSSLFSRFFPTPRLLSMEGGGLEITERSIKYLRIAHHAFGRRVAVYGEEPLPDGVIVGGEIKNEEALSNGLHAVRARCGFHFVHVSLPEQRGYIFDLEILRGGSLRDAILLAIPSHVPLSPAEVVFDCETVRFESKGEMLATVVTAFPEVIASQYARALTTAKFLPLSFELEPQAAARAVTSRMQEVQTGAHLFIDLGVNKTLFSIVQSGIVRFATSIAGSAESDSAFISRGGTAETLVHTKQEEGFTADGPFVETFGKYASAVVAEVCRLMVYWNSRGEGRVHDPISSIVLYGGNANIKKFAERISEGSGIPALIADLRPALTGARDNIPPIPKNESVRYATAIGLALRDQGTAIW